MTREMLKNEWADKNEWVEAHVKIMTSLGVGGLQVK